MGLLKIRWDFSGICLKTPANAVIFYNASLLSTLHQHFLSVDPEMARTIARFSPVAWQHISFIGKYEFYNRGDAINIQELISKLMVDSAIDLSDVS